MLKEADGMNNHSHMHVLVILVLLLSVFVYTVAAQGAIDSFEIDLDEDTVTEGEVIEGSLEVSFSGPVAGNIGVRGEIEDSVNEKSLVNLLDDGSVSYETETSSGQMLTGSDSKNLVFTGAGSQTFYFKLPSAAIVRFPDGIFMNVHGRLFDGDYPKEVSMDVGEDSTIEWFFLGALSGFNVNFIPNSNLNENQQSSVIVQDSNLYCEIIDVPRVQDLRVSARYGYDASNTLLEGDLHAVVLSLQGTAGSSSVGAQGGANRCDLPEPASLSASPSYRTCDVFFEFPVEGEQLVCIFNNETSVSGDLYTISRDSSTGVGYGCGPLGTTGSTQCTRISGDFFIKAQAGIYTEELNRMALLPEGFTEFPFETALSASLSGCTTDDCLIPVKVSSTRKGIVYMDNLQLYYQEGIAQSVESQFYDVSTASSVITEIDGVELGVDNDTVDIPFDSLGLVAPVVSGTRNKTLEIEFVPGPTETISVTIEDSGNGTTATLNVSTSDAAGFVAFYKALYQTILGDYSDFLEIKGMKSTVSNAVSSLEGFRNQLNNLPSGNQSAQVEQQKQQIRTQAANLVDDLPQKIITLKTLSEQVVVEPGDVSNDVVLSNQQSSDQRNRIYFLNQNVAVTVDASVIQVTDKNGVSTKYTYVKKTANGDISNAYLVEVIPNSLAATTTDVDFKVAPQFVKDNPLIARREFSTLNNAIFEYILEDDVIANVASLKTVVVPKVIPSSVAQATTSCGDGVCSFIDVNGERVPLEDEYTCPQDCKGKLPLTTIIVIVVVALIIVAYLNFYKGKGSFKSLSAKKPTKIVSQAKGKKPEPFFKRSKERPLFSSRKDEKALDTYVKNALGKKVGKAKLTKALLSKGWTREQLEYIYKKSKK